MREIFTYGSVGGAPGNRCFYPEIGTRYGFVGDSTGLTPVKLSFFQTLMCTLFQHLQ